MTFWYYIFVYIASMLLTEALRPRPKKDTTRLVNAGDVNVPQADEGVPVPIIFGTVQTEGLNVVDAWGLRIRREMERVNSGLFSHTTVFKYDEFSLSADVAICSGWTDYDVQGGSEILGMYLGDVSIFPQSKVISTDTHGKHWYIDKLSLWGDETSGGLRGGMKLFYGKTSQPVDTALQTARGLQSACRGVCRMVFGYPTQVLIPYQPIGDEDTPPPQYRTDGTFVWGHSESIENPMFRIKRTPRPWSDVAGQYWNIDGGANPAVALYLLYSLYSAEPFDDTEIDVGSFKACASVLASEKLGISMRIDSQRGLDEVRSEIEQLIDCRVEVNEETGLLTMRLIRATDAVALDIAPDDIVEVSSFGRPALTEIVNRVKVSYTYINTAPTAPLTFATKTVVASSVATAVERTSDISAPALGTKAAAQLVASRMLKAQSNPMPRMSCVVQKPEAQQLRVGDRVRVATRPIVDADEIVYRVSKVVKPAFGEHTTNLELVGDSFGVGFETVSGSDESNVWGGLPDAEGFAFDAPTELTGDASHLISFVPTTATATTILYGEDFEKVHGTLNQRDVLKAAVPAGATELPIYNTTTGLTLNYYSTEAFAGKAQIAAIFDPATFEVRELVAFKDVGVGTSGDVCLRGVERGRFGTVPTELEAGDNVLIIATSAPLLTNDPLQLWKPANRAGEPTAAKSATQLLRNDALVYPPDALKFTLALDRDKGVVDFNARLTATCTASNTLTLATDPAHALPLGYAHHYEIYSDATALLVKYGTCSAGDELHTHLLPVGDYTLHVWTEDADNNPSPHAIATFTK